MKRCLDCGATFSGATWRCPSCRHEPPLVDGIRSFAPSLSSNSGFRDELFQELAALEASHFWFRARQRLIIWVLRQYFPAAIDLLEIGCGTGFVLSYCAKAFPQLVLTGSEISTQGLQHAIRRVPGALFIQMDARAIPFTDEFDVIGAFDVLEHIEDDQAVLQQAFTALRPGGGIILSVPQHAFLWSDADVHACHVRRYAARDLASKFKAAGFQILRLTSFVSFLLPLMFVSRRRRRVVTQDWDPLHEFKISRLTNILLGGVIHLERRLITLGLDLPVGGSLLLVGKKS